MNRGDVNEIPVQPVTAGSAWRVAVCRIEAMSLRRFLLWAAGLFLLLSLFAYLPMWPGDPHLMVNCVCGDSVQQSWYLGYVPWAIVHGHNPFFTTYVDYPRGVNLVSNTTMPLLGVIFSPISALFGSVSTYNLLMWLAYPVSAISMTYVVGKWSRSNAASLLAGLVYGFSPYVAHQGYGHLNLSFVPLPPLILYVLYRIFVVQSGNSRRWGLGLGLLVVGQFYISAEVVVSTLLVSVVGLIIASLARRSELTTDRVRFVTGALVPGVLVVLLLTAYPVAFQFFGPDAVKAPAQASIGNPYRADFFGSLVPTSFEQFAPVSAQALGNKFTGGALVENGSYLGIPLFILFALTLFRFRRHGWMLLCGALATFSWVLSLGPKLVVAGHATGIVLPFDFLGQFKVMNDLLPARFSLMETFFVVVTVAMGLTLWRQEFATALRKEPRRRPLRYVGRPTAVGLSLGVVASLIALVPNWPIPVVSNSNSVPPFFSTSSANAIPSGSNVLTYPYVYPNFSENALLWQISTNWRWKVMGGYFEIPGPYPDSVVATPWPTPPLDVADYLEYWETLSSSSSGAAPAVTATLISDTKVFVNRYQISTIVVDLATAHATAAVRLFSAAFGRATSEAGVDVWFSPASLAK